MRAGGAPQLQLPSQWGLLLEGVWRLQFLGAKLWTWGFLLLLASPRSGRPSSPSFEGNFGVRHPLSPSPSLPSVRSHICVWSFQHGRVVQVRCWRALCGHVTGRMCRTWFVLMSYLIRLVRSGFVPILPKIASYRHDSLSYLLSSLQFAVQSLSFVPCLHTSYFVLRSSS